MSLVDCISKDVIKIPLVAKNKIAVLEELVEVLFAAGKITDKSKAITAIIERESKQSTGLKDGLAVPHGKTEVVKKLTIAIGVAPKGIEYDSLDGKPAKLFFLLLAPPNQPGPHVEALAEIARLSQSQAFCRAIINADSAAEILELLQED